MRRLAPALVALAACATARGPASPPPPEEIRFADPAVVEATALGVELAGKNDEELFAVGTAAFAAGDFTRAAAAFGRLADLFPASGHHPAALYDAGLAHQRLSEWRLALERFRALERGYVGPDADEASFRAAECLWHLGDLADTRAVLTAWRAARTWNRSTTSGPSPGAGWWSWTRARPRRPSARCELALLAWNQRDDRERLDDYFPAQAQYYLGEVYRRHFQAVRLDPSRDGEAELEKALELKAELPWR